MFVNRVGGFDFSHEIFESDVPLVCREIVRTGKAIFDSVRDMTRLLGME
jgi:hypothetical protein